MEQNMDVCLFVWSYSPSRDCCGLIRSTWYLMVKTPSLSVVISYTFA